MLLLTRRIGESVVIGDDVRVTVTHVKGRQVGLAFVAPDHVRILREQLFEQIPAGISSGRIEGVENGSVAAA